MGEFPHHPVSKCFYAAHGLNLQTVGHSESSWFTSEMLEVCSSSSHRSLWLLLLFTLLPVKLICCPRIPKRILFYWHNFDWSCGCLVSGLTHFLWLLHNKGFSCASQVKSFEYVVSSGYFYLDICLNRNLWDKKKGWLMLLFDYEKHVV